MWTYFWVAAQREHSLKGTPIPVLARLNDIHPITLYSWKRKMTNESSIDVKALLREIEQLKKDKNKLLKKGTSRAREFIKEKKKGSKKMICSKFGIHPKSIYKDKGTRTFYKKSNDSQVLTQINAIISLRPTYGYKRVTAMVNKPRKSLGHNKVNKKRIYRIMKINGLLLPKSVVTRTHKPTGVIVLKLNALTEKKFTSHL
jgi:hypothetical protein